MFARRSFRTEIRYIANNDEFVSDHVVDNIDDGEDTSAKRLPSRSKRTVGIDDNTDVGVFGAAFKTLGSIIGRKTLNDMTANLNEMEQAVDRDIIDEKIKHDNCFTYR